ncbi:MAG: SAM-dependent DNA methyltransferase [Bacteroidales bacterium]|nr:SAM-dependent DNA methyltransferase [Bacteroidales bacterium]
MAVKTKHLVSGYRVPGEPISLDEMKTFLWGAATRLRGQIDAAGYKEYIFPLLFFKRISDVYDEQYNGFLREGGEEYAGMQVEDLAIKIPQGAHWDDVREVTENVGQKLVEAFIAIEQANPGEEVDGRVVGGLEGIFGPKDGWTNKSKMPDSIITSLIEDFSRYNLSLESCPADEMGQAYEYLVGKFADDAGNTAQEFYTNRTVVTLMAEILQPKPDESIYDPTCGSGGMLIKCLNYLRDKGQSWQGVKVFGQEINALTASIARMNLYLNGVEDFSIVREDTLSHPAFVDGSRLRKFDIVLANPPYSIKQWNRDAFAHDYWGRNMFGTPPQGRADYAFIQHIIASMDEKTGRCAILLPHGILGRLEEQEIREGLLETDLVDCVIGIGKNLFYNSPMEACIVICRSKKPIESKDNILFINAKHLVTRKNAESYLEPEHIAEIAACYHERKEIPGFSKVATRDEVKANKCYLSIGLYVERQGDDSGASIDNLVQDWDETAVSAANELSILTILIQQKYDC